MAKVTVLVSETLVFLALGSLCIFGYAVSAALASPAQFFKERTGNKTAVVVNGIGHNSPKHFPQ